MFSKILLTLLFFSGVSSKSLDLRNIRSIFMYFKKIESTALNYYKFESSLNEEENKQIVDQIHTHKLKIFAELKSMSLEFARNYDDAEWTDVIALIGIHGFKIKPDYMVLYFFSVANEIDGLLKKIDESMILFRPIGQMDLYDGNVSTFCTYTLPTLDPFFNILRQKNLSKLYVKFIGRLVKPELMSILSEQNKNKINLCGKNVSFNRALWNYYHLIMMGHIKYCAMLYFKWVMDVRCANQATEYDIKWLDLATEQSQKIMNETRRAMKNVNFYVYNCDPNADEREHMDTYVELKRMIQAVVLDENDLSTTQSCSHDCNLELIGDKVNRTECQEFRDCRSIDYDVEICQLDRKSKRYKWIRDRKGNVYGRNKTCENLRSLSKNLGRSDACGYCLCTCVIRPTKSSYVTIAISFREQVSDIRANMVITSLQFIEQDYMVHIQVMVGQLLPEGQVSDERWLELDNCDYDESTGQYKMVHRNGTHTPLILGADYGHPGSIYTDDLIAPPGHVVTGVRLRFAEESAGAIQLQIRVTPVDYVKGKLENLAKTQWIAADSSIRRSELILENPNRSSRCQKNIPDSAPNQFIRFQASDMRKDAGQSTVPFFDAQIVSMDEIAPLGGLGFYHRGAKGCGGFVAIRAHDLELSRFLTNRL